MSKITRLTRRRLAAAATVGLTTAGMLVGLTTGAAHASGLTNVTLTLSNNAAGANGADASGANANGVTYTWGFTTGASDTVDGTNGIALAVPAGTTGTPTVTNLYGTTGCSGVVWDATLASNTITIKPDASGTTSCVIGTSTGIAVVVGGLVNPTSAVTSATYSVTVGGSDTGTTNSVSIASNSTTINVLVPESLTFTNNTSSVFLNAIPGGAYSNAAPVSMSVATNAAQGYTLSACMTSANQLTATVGGGSATISAVSGAATQLTGSNYGFGASVTATGDGTNSVLSYDNGWDGTSSSTGTVNPYATTCTGTGANVVTDSKPTNGDTIALTNTARVQGVQPAGLYSGKVTYTVAPSF